MQSIIELENVSKKFTIKGRDFWALKGVTFRVKEGEIFGLLGPNGAGKTTILNIILGLYFPVIANGMVIDLWSIFFLIPDFNHS